MKFSKILVYINCGMFLLLGFPAVGDSQFGHRRGEFSSQQHWKRGYEDKSSHVFKREQRQEAEQNSDNKRWKRRVRTEHSKSDRGGDNSNGEGRYKESDNKTKSDRRHTGKTPPPKQDHRNKDHRPKQDSHRRQTTKPNIDRDHDRKRHVKPNTYKLEVRRSEQHNRHHEHKSEHRTEHRYPARQEHREPNRHYHPGAHKHRSYKHVPHKHKPKYRLHKRHKHTYYRSPWYNTLFLAPILWHYYDIGYTLEVLPSPYIRIVVGGLPYFYARGTFYRPYGSDYIVVSAPIGAVVTALPIGYIAFSIGLNTYYFANDVYYVWDEPKDGFVVVQKPEGAEQAIEQATQGRLYAYPNEGQSEEQQARDRYECHRWAVAESDVDPTIDEQDYSDDERREYQRAMAACLEGRGYTVK